MVLPMMKRGELELVVVVVARGEGEVVSGATDDELTIYLFPIYLCILFFVSFLYPLFLHLFLFFYFSLLLCLLLTNIDREDYDFSANHCM